MELRLSCCAVAVLFITFTRLRMIQATVQFKFNRADLDIFEGEDLPSQLSIIKNGQHEANISFHIVVIPGTAQDNIDYLSNSRNSYVFTMNTNQLPIRTELEQDRSGEAVENFMICLPNAQVLLSVGAVAVEPLCVTITIVDDDSVVIGFRNSFQTVIEGETVTVCVDVKPQGLPLDPFDRIRLPLRITPVVRETILSTNSLLFETGNVRCATLSIVDNDILEGSRSYQLILESNGDSTVPVLLYPNTTLIIVIDNDRQDTSFSIYSPQRVISVLEGGRTDNVSVQKSSSSALSYNVSLVFTHHSRLEGVVIPKSLIFDPSTTRKAVDIVTMDDTTPGDRIEFNISIGSVVAIEASGATSLASVLGGPVKIVIYDNDFEIGFTKDEFLVPEDSSNADVCIGIIVPETSSDIEPSLMIPIQVILENSTSCNLTLDKNDLVLSANNNMDCLTVTHSGGCNRARSYTITLTSTVTLGQKHTVYYFRQNASITITAMQSLGKELQLRSAVIIGIAIAMALLLVIATIMIISVTAKVMIKRRNERKSDRKRTPSTVTKSPTVKYESNLIHDTNISETDVDHISDTIPESNKTECSIESHVELTSDTPTLCEPADNEKTLKNLTQMSVSEEQQKVKDGNEERQTDLEDFNNSETSQCIQKEQNLELQSVSYS